MKWSVYVGLFLICFSSKAQILRSIVCDSTTKQPLLGASVYIKSNNIGTITNKDGQFSVKLQGKGTFSVSYIGYNTKIFNTQNLPDTLFLSENNQLNEVVVMPDSSLKVLLRKAYNNIEKNYAQTPTYQTGFYREVFENKSQKKFNYFSESFLKVYKPPYTKKGAGYSGQLKLLKSRTIKHPTYQKTGDKYIGGPFLALYGDKVLRRTPCIAPNYFKNYVYDLESVTTYDGRVVYVIRCEQRDSSYQAKIYIDKESLAYLKFEIVRQRKRDIADFKQESVTEHIQFDKQGNRLFLRHIRLELTGKTGNDDAQVLLEFVTNRYEEDSVKEFSYGEQLLLSEVIADQTSDFSDSFFEGQEAVLKPTAALDDQIKLAFAPTMLDSLKSKQTVGEQREQSENRFKKTFDIKDYLMRLNMSIGLGVAPVQSFTADFAATVRNIFPEKWALNTSTKATNLPITYDFGVNYRLNRRFYVRYYENKSLFSNTKIKARDVGVAYKMVMNKAKKPIIITPHLSYSFLESGVSFGKSDNPSKSTVVEGTEINSKTLTARLLQKNNGLKGGIGISVFSKGLNKLFVQADYFYPLSTAEPFLRIQENTFLGRDRKVNLPLRDPRVELSTTQTLQLPQLRNNWWLGLAWRRVL